MHPSTSEMFNAEHYNAKKENDNQLTMALINCTQEQLYQLKEWNMNASKYNKKLIQYRIFDIETAAIMKIDI